MRDEHGFERGDALGILLECVGEGWGFGFGFGAFGGESEEVGEAAGFCRGDEVGVVGGRFPAGFLDEFEEIVDLVDLDHGLHEAGGVRDFGEIGGDFVDEFGIELGCVGGAGVKAFVVRRGAGDFHAFDGLFWSHPAEACGDGPGGASASVFAVMAVEIDGTILQRIAGGAGEFELALFIEAVVADGQVDVADTDRIGLGNIGLGAVDADDGFDAHRLEQGECGVAFGDASGIETFVVRDDVVQAGEVAGFFVFQRGESVWGQSFVGRRDFGWNGWGWLVG